MPLYLLFSDWNSQVYLALADAVVREAYRAGETKADIPQVIDYVMSPGQYMSETLGLRRGVANFVRRSVKDDVAGDDWRKREGCQDGRF